MLDFTPVRKKEMTMAQLVANLSPNDLRRETNEMIDAMLGMTADCTDADVTFVPDDPQADDRFAAAEAERNIPWTLGHVIVHVTASAEESAYLAVELARGVAYRGGRSRSEVPWQTVKTIAQCRQRLEESRRMRLASLDMWPDQPHLENTYVPRERRKSSRGWNLITLGFLHARDDLRVLPMNALARFVSGLRHDDDHLKHIAEIVRQAKAARVAI